MVSIIEKNKLKIWNCQFKKNKIQR